MLQIYMNIKNRRKQLKMTQTELAKRLGYADKSSIAKIESGLTDISQSKITALAQALNTTPAHLMGWDDQQDTNNPYIVNGVDISKIPGIILPKTRRLPILGTICAGDGIWCEENFQGYFFADNHVKGDFVLIVKGDSMIDAGIYDGDLAFIRETLAIEKGRIGAFLLEDNTVTLKKVYYNETSFILQACNANFEPIIVKNVIVLGECVGVYHNINKDS